MNLKAIGIGAQKSTILSLVSGAFQLGFVVFLVFRALVRWWGWTLHQLALGYCIPLLVLLVVGFFVWPDTPFMVEEEVEKRG